jgi:hypothetical protein
MADEKIKPIRWYQYNPNMTEREIRTGNRLYGLCLIAFSGIVASAGNVTLDLLAAPFVIEGIGDIITGDHHYLGSKLLKRLGIGGQEANGR